MVLISWKLKYASWTHLESNFRLKKRLKLKNSKWRSKSEVTQKLKKWSLCCRVFLQNDDLCKSMSKSTIEQENYNFPFGVLLVKVHTCIEWSRLKDITKQERYDVKNTFSHFINTLVSVHLLFDNTMYTITIKRPFLIKCKQYAHIRFQQVKIILNRHFVSRFTSLPVLTVFLTVIFDQKLMT